MSHDQVPVLTALADPSEEAALAAAWAGPGRPVRISRRCVDTADLLAAATTGQARAAVVSAGLARFDLNAVAHLGAQGVAVVGLCMDEAEERRLRMWGAAAVLSPGGRPGRHRRRDPEGGRLLPRRRQPPPRAERGFCCGGRPRPGHGRPLRDVACSAQQRRRPRDGALGRADPH